MLEGQSINEFTKFPSIARLNREIVVTEKIDGTNAQILITEDGQLKAGSRTRYITPQDDNFGFAKWCEQNKEELLKMGPGRWFGEWWGLGIQRGYDLFERGFSLFHTNGIKELPKCCNVVPILYQGLFETGTIKEIMSQLSMTGSKAAPGFMKPEGVVIYHTAGRCSFKVTFENDEGKHG